MRDIFLLVPFLGGEAGATLNPPALQDLLTSPTIIAFHKTMFGFALAFVWLVCTFRHVIYIFLLNLANTCLSIT